MDKTPLKPSAPKSIKVVKKQLKKKKVIRKTAKSSKKPKPTTSQPDCRVMVCSRPGTSRTAFAPRKFEPGRSVVVRPRPGTGRRGVMPPPTRPPQPPADDMCAICLETAASKAAATRQLFCGHTFHRRCVEAWFKKKYSCPVCRSPPDALTDTYITRFNAFAENLRRWFLDSARRGFR